MNKGYFKVEGKFIPAQLFNGKFDDPNYIEGAVEMTVDDAQLLTTRQWDYVDQLWGYFVNGLEEVAQGRAFSTYFPDQSIEVTFTPRSAKSSVEITVKIHDTRQAIVPYGEFMRVMISEGKAFFNRMALLVPQDRAAYMALVNQLDGLKV